MLHILGDTGLIIARVHFEFTGEVRLVNFTTPSEATSKLRHLKIGIIEAGRAKTTRIILDFFCAYDLQEAQRFEVRIDLLKSIPQQIFY